MLLKRSESFHLDLYCQAWLNYLKRLAYFQKLVSLCPIPEFLPRCLRKISLLLAVTLSVSFTSALLSIHSLSGYKRKV